MPKKYEWNPDRLNPNIWKKLKEDPNMGAQSIRNALSQYRKKHRDITMNAAAQLFSEDRGFSILRSLTYEDKKTLPKEITKSKLKKQSLSNPIKQEMRIGILHNTLGNINISQTIKKNSSNKSSKKEQKRKMDMGVIMAVIAAASTRINNLITRFFPAWPDWEWVGEVIFIISIILIIVIYTIRNKK